MNCPWFLRVRNLSSRRRAVAMFHIRTVWERGSIDYLSGVGPIWLQARRCDWELSSCSRRVGRIDSEERSDFQSPFQTVGQGIRFEWLSQQAYRTDGCCSCFQPRLSICGYHDHEHAGVMNQEPPREIKAAHAGHVNIGDETVVRFCSVASDNFFCRCKPTRAIS